MRYLEDPDVTLLLGDAVECLRSLPDESVHMAVTSPPFYGLRDYGVDGQIGLEDTPELWVDRLVAVFREVRRVLRADGTLWVEIGDSYVSSPPGNKDTLSSGLHGAQGAKYAERLLSKDNRGARPRPPNVKPKDLIGAPWLLAFALRADGWYLRSEIIWAKPNPMPESVSDRPTTAHSRVFLLAKSPRYFFDAEAVREKYQDPREGGEGFRWNSERYTEQVGPQNNSVARGPDGRKQTGVRGADGSLQHRDGERWPNPSGRNVRSVWEIATQSFPLAHFATFPEALVRRCILAGTSERGCCRVCGAPWLREVETEYVKSPVHGAGSTVRSRSEDDPNGWSGEVYPRLNKSVTTIGWRPSCDLHDPGPVRASAPTVPCTILDPFVGSGTTCFVARKLGRRAIGVDLSEDYLQMASRRLAQQSLFAVSS